MPQRTNEFQELVALIQQRLSPNGAKVTASAMVEVEGLSTLREIDVLVEGDLGDFKMKVAYEAKDERRKFDLTAFDSYLGKYQGPCGIKVDRFVIVARSGFTEGVKEKARATGVELITLDEAKGTDWSRFIPGGAVLKIAPHICKLKVEPPVDCSEAELRSARVICKCCGRDHGALGPFAAKKLIHYLENTCPEKGQEFKAIVERETEGYAEAEWIEDFYEIRIGDKQYPLSKYAVKLHAVHAVGSTTCKQFKRDSTAEGSRLINHFRSDVGRKRISVVMPDGLRSEKIVIKIEDRPTAEGRRGLRGKRLKERKKQERRTRRGK